MGLFVSSSDVLLFVYKNTIDIYMLFFYPATSLNLLTRSSRFLVESLGFSICEIISLANRDGFISYFPILILFFFLPDYFGKDFQYYVE